MLLGICSSTIASRFLLPEGRGEMAIIQYFPSLMGTFCCLAIPSAITFFISRSSDRANYYSASGVHISVVLGVVGAVLFAILAPFSLADKDHHLLAPVTLACLVSPGMVINPHLLAIHRGFRRFKWVNLMMILSASLYVVFLVSLWAFGWISPLNAVLASIAAQFVAILLNVFQLGKTKIFRLVPMQVYKELSLLGLRHFISVLSITIYQMADRAILMHMTTLEEIGYYSVAFGLAAPLQTLIEPFVEIGFVEMSEKNNKKELANILIRRFQIAQIVLMCALLVITPLTYPFILYCLGYDFMGCLIITYIMYSVMMLRALSRVIIIFMRVINKNIHVAVINLFGLTIVSMLSLYIFLHMGSLGFVLSLLITESIRLILLIGLCIYFIHIPVNQLWGLRLSVGRSIITNIGRSFQISQC